MARSLVIVNPMASRVREAAAREGVIERARAALTRRDGTAPEIVVTEAASSVPELVRQAVEAGVAAVVGVGGDGTLREVTGALAGTGVPLGIVPAGTGNLVAGSLGITGSPQQAADLLATARPRPLDLGRARFLPAAGGEAPDIPFLVACGLGFEARVMAATPAGLKRTMGRAAYFLTAARLGLHIRSIPFHITVDGTDYDIEAAIAMAVNLGDLVPGFIAPRLPADPADGQLDVIVAGARGPLSAIRSTIAHLYRTELGHDPRTATLRLRGRSVRLAAEPAEPAQVDGDHLGPGVLEATVDQAAVSVLVPAG